MHYCILLTDVGTNVNFTSVSVISLENSKKINKLLPGRFAVPILLKLRSSTEIT